MSPNAHVCPISQQKPYGNTISPPRESYDRYIERPKEEVLEPVYDYLQDDEVNTVQKPYDSYRINPPSAPQENLSYKRPDYPQYGPEYEYRDEGHENEEEYDRVNEEEGGRYEVKNYRQPIKVGYHIYLGSNCILDQISVCARPNDLKEMNQLR